MNYQSTKDEKGVMPTLEWFEKIKAHVDFKDKSVIDFGCAEGMMCILAKEAGAGDVLGIDNQNHFALEVPGILFSFSDIEKGEDHAADIKIFSMIIHWIDKDQTLRRIEYCDTAVIIFREKNAGYQIPTNGKWFPTLKELDEALQGFRRVHSEKLMEQDNNKNILLAIYERNE